MSKVTKVTNATTFRGDDIRRFTQAGLRGKGNPESVKLVHWTETNSYRPSGVAYVDTGQIVMSISRGFNPLEGWDMLELGQIFEHEVDHCIGLDHKDMQPWSALDPKWIYGLRIRRRKGFERPQHEAIEQQIKRLTLELDLLEPGT